MKINKTVELYAAMGLLSLFAVSCDRNNEIAEDISGEMIEVRVNILGVTEGQSEDVMRSASLSPLTGRQEITMISQPIGDGMLLEMSLEPDESAPLRATPVPLEDGKKFRVIALSTDGKYVSHGDFTVTQGVDNTSPSLHVKKGVTHDFICLSYNSTSKGFSDSYASETVATFSTSSIGSDDLLYDKLANQTFNSAEEAILSFELKHQLSKVTLVVDCTYNEWPVSSVAATGIYLQPNYRAATMKLQDWSVTTKGSTAAVSFAGWQPSGDTYSQTSAEQRVFTNNEKISLIVPTNSLTINGNNHPSSAQTISFLNRSSLVPGASYTLHLRIRTPKWATSNIYWDNTTDSNNPTLRFDPWQSDGSTAPNRGYQGVFFRWGSLVGISPAQNGGSNAYSGTVPLYVPYGYPSTPKWKATNGNSTGSDMDINERVRYNYSAWGYASYNAAAPANNIPFMDGLYAKAGETTFGRSNTYVIDAALNADTTYQGLRGDICQYLSTKTHVVSGDYRLPVSYEFTSVTPHVWQNTHPDGWVKNGGTFRTTGLTSVGYPNGRADLLSNVSSAAFDPLTNSHATNTVVYGSVKNTKAGNVVLPLAGARLQDGYLDITGAMGIYWSGSAQANTSSGSYGVNAYLCEFDMDDFTSTSNNRCFGFSVRCVKN
jgi:hypothetical protein